MSEEISVPEPNYMAEQSRDSQVEQEDVAVCGNCQNEFEIILYVSFGGGQGEIKGLPAGFDVELIETYDQTDPFYWEIPSTEQLRVFEKHLASISKLLKLQLDSEAEFSLLVMLYAHVVAATEQFLSSVFIREVTNSDKLIKKLIESNPELGSRKLTMQDIYQETAKIKNTVETYLKDLIFHDLKKIKPMYLSVLEYEFKDISWLFRAVNKRHDCVHRAGYGKDGVKISIDKNEVIELIKKCKILAESIDSHVISPKKENFVLEVSSNFKSH